MANERRLTKAERTQRTAVVNYAAKHILGVTVDPTSRDSFYRHVPSDPEFRDMYDRAQGDPGLYAIYHAIEVRRQALHAAQSEGSPTDVDEARAAMTEAKDLELQYRFPGDYPFESPIDPGDA